MKTKFVNKYENYRIHKGTVNVMENLDDKANQSRKEEIDIKLMIEKYGILPFELLNKAREPLYLNEIGDDLTLNQRMKQKEQIENYFETLPANVRKQFNDKSELMYQKIQAGDFNLIKELNIMEENEINRIQTEQNKKNIKIQQLENELKELKGTQNVKETNTMEKD